MGSAKFRQKLMVAGLAADPVTDLPEHHLLCTSLLGLQELPGLLESGDRDRLALHKAFAWMYEHHPDEWELLGMLWHFADELLNSDYDKEALKRAEDRLRNRIRHEGGNPVPRRRRDGDATLFTHPDVEL